MNDHILYSLLTVKHVLIGQRASFTERRENQEGASAVEYGLLIAGIAAVIVVIVFALGGVINGVFSKTNSCINSAGATCS